MPRCFSHEPDIAAGPEKPLMRRVLLRRETRVTRSSASTSFDNPYNALSILCIYHQALEVYLAVSTDVESRIREP